MRIRRTGAKRGQSPIWYVQASTESEAEAIRAGLLADVAPDRRYLHVLAWGFGTRQAAVEAMEELQEQVGNATQSVEAVSVPRLPSSGSGR